VRWIASMWRDIFGFTGTILAVVNGLIAFGIALLPSRRSVYRLLGCLFLSSKICRRTSKSRKTSGCQ